MGCLRRGCLAGCGRGRKSEILNLTKTLQQTKRAPGVIAAIWMMHDLLTA